MLASLKRLFLRLFSRPSLAPIFIGIRKIGGYGLNYNAAALLDVESSGEGKALDYMLSKLPRGQRLTLFDVGASVGDYIEAFIRRCPSTYSISAFEPTTANQAILKNKFGANSSVLVFPYGLSDSSKEATIYYPWSGGNASLSLKTMEQQIDSSTFEKEVVCLETLDKHLELYPCERIHILKVDVEGHEMCVFRGGQHMLNSLQINFIQFEFGNGSLQASTTFCDFWDAFHNSYNFYLILNNGLLPVDRYGLDWENYHTANFLLELKTCFLSQ